MGFDSPVHWLIVILIIALLFGGSRVGNLMGELGKGLRSFKQNMADPNEAAKPATEPRISETIPPPQSPIHQPVRETVVVTHSTAEPALPPDSERR